MILYIIKLSKGMNSPRVLSEFIGALKAYEFADNEAGELSKFQLNMIILLVYFPFKN